MSSRPDRGWWPDSGWPDSRDIPRSQARAAPPGIDVWHVGLDPAARAVAAAARADRPGRAAAGRPDPRCAGGAPLTLAAHGALRIILGEYLCRPGEEVRWETGPNGKPGFVGPDGRWQWSLTRSGGHALLGVSLTAALGVDLEALRDDIEANVLARRFLPPEEAAAVGAGPSPFVRRQTYQRLLTRKEACAKASGGRFLDALGLNVLRPGTVPGAGRLAGQRWTLRDLPVPAGFRPGALAVAAAEIGPVRLLEWGWAGEAAPPGQPAAKVPPCCRANRLAAPVRLLASGTRAVGRR